MDNSSDILVKQKIHTPLILKGININNTISILNNEKLKYETETGKLKNKINNVLGNKDIYEDKQYEDCIPDYKFPEIRWDETTDVKNPYLMTDDEIRNKFQLLSEESQKRKMEFCKTCYKTGKRGIIFDINFFYKGNENWDSNIPKTGKSAELGCEGCGGYDIARWRKELLKVLNDEK